MSQIRTNFPALERRRGSLRLELDAWEKASNYAFDKNNEQAGSTMIVAERRLTSAREELDELYYVLGYFDMLRFRDLQGWRTWQTVVMIIVAALALLLSLFSVWRG